MNLDFVRSLAEKDSSVLGLLLRISGEFHTSQLFAVSSFDSPSNFSFHLDFNLQLGSSASLHWIYFEFNLTIRLAAIYFASPIFG